MGSQSKDRDVFAFVREGMAEAQRQGERTRMSIEARHLREKITQYEAKIRERDAEIDRLRTAVEHCKHEFHNRGVRETLWTLKEHAEKCGPPGLGQILNMYNDAVRAFSGYPGGR